MKKNRIVVKVESYVHFAYDREYPSARFVEVYSSVHKVDCIKWIKQQLIKRHLPEDNKIAYKIFVEEEY